MEEKVIKKNPGGMMEDIVDIPWLGEAPANGKGKYVWNEGPDAQKIEMYIELAEAGNPKAMEMLMDVFLYGKRDFKVNYDIALKWGLKLIETDAAGPNAWQIVGRCYEENLNDYETALKYYKTAAEKGDFKALRYVAMLYWNEKLSTPDEGDKDFKESAVKYMKIAASTMDRTAKSCLGRWYYDGMIETENGKTAWEMALEYLTPAVDGSHGSEPGVKEARECIKKIYEEHPELNLADNR